MSRRTGHKSLRNGKEEFLLDKTRAVRKYSMTGVFITEYKSLYEISMRASENYNIKMIYKCCIRETASSYGHQWRFKDDDELAVKAGIDGSTEPVKPLPATGEVDEPYVKFGTPLRPNLHLEIQGVVAGRCGFDVIDLDSMRSETLVASELFWHKAYGDIIGGCSFHTNGLMIRLENTEPYVIPFEAWRDFNVRDEKYFVSNLGRVCSRDKDSGQKVMLPTYDDGRYCCVDLSDGNGEVVTEAVADLVAMAFVIDFDPEIRITHLDGNRMNCALGNLSCNVDAADYGVVPIEPISEYTFSRIDRYNIADGELNVYASVSEAAALTGLSRDCITQCCDGKYLTYAGSFWCYGDKDMEYYKLKQDERVKLCGGIIRQYNPAGKLLAEYMSSTDVSEKTGMSCRSIEMACQNKKPRYGYAWRTVSDDELYLLSEEERRAKMPFRAVRQYTKSGYLLREYDTIGVAAKELCISSDDIYMSVETPEKCPFANGYVWRFADNDNLFDKSEVERAKAIGYQCVRQYSSEGEFIGEHDSVEDAYFATGVSKEHIIASCGKADKIDRRDFVWRHSYDDELMIMSVRDRVLVMSRLFLPIEQDEDEVEYIDSEPFVSDDGEVWVVAPLFNVKFGNGAFKYEVSDKGRVKVRSESKNESFLLTQYEKKYGGHLTVTLVDENSVSHIVPVDRLVALAFVTKPANLNKVWHKDGDVQNNEASNLTWARKSN